MKAVCVNRFLGGGIFIDEGETIDYIADGDSFIIVDVRINSPAFFFHFKVAEGEVKMKYSDFEYILCNYIFTMSVLFPEEYNGMHHLIIQNLDDVILITVNREETVIRVSFNNGQETYSSYEEALDGIKKYQQTKVMKWRDKHYANSNRT